MDDLGNWQLWTPLIGGILLYVGLRIRVIEVVDED